MVRYAENRMSDPSDWRLMGQEKYLRGAELCRRTYRRYPDNPNWDHDHCEYCTAKFTPKDDPEGLHDGYCTLDEYRWICSNCFEDFKEMFAWRVVPAPAE
jgi:hypothetical protein